MSLQTSNIGLMDFADIEWDEGNRDKCAKHGLSEAEVAQVLHSTSRMLIPDERHSDIEPRFIAIGQTHAGRHAFVVFTPRDHAGKTYLRPVSARYLHAKEVKKYVEEAARLQNR